jgi:hypothetical protein
MVFLKKALKKPKQGLRDQTEAHIHPFLGAAARFGRNAKRTART